MLHLLRAPYSHIVISLPQFNPISFSKEARQGRKMQLERQMIGLAEDKKQQLRRHLEHEEMLIQKESMEWGQ